MRGLGVKLEDSQAMKEFIRFLTTVATFNRIKTPSLLLS